MERLNKFLRKILAGILSPLVWLFSKLNISPDALSILGALLSLGVGYLFYKGLLLYGGIGILVSGLFDAIDGAVARRRELVSEAGAFLDSTLDRYSDIIILSGIVYYSFKTQDSFLLCGTLLFILGTVVIPYARAKAESLSQECKVGFLPRHFRLVFLAIGAIIGGEVFRWFVLFLGILSNITAIHRILYAFIKLKKK